MQIEPPRTIGPCSSLPALIQACGATRQRIKGNATLAATLGVTPAAAPSHWAAISGPDHAPSQMAGALFHTRALDCRSTLAAHLAGSTGPTAGTMPTACRCSLGR